MLSPRDELLIGELVSAPSCSTSLRCRRRQGSNLRPPTVANVDSMRSPATGSTPLVTHRPGRLFEPAAAPATCECECYSVVSVAFRVRFLGLSPLAERLRLTVTLDTCRTPNCGVVYAGRRSTVGPTRVTAAARAGRRHTVNASDAKVTMATCVNLTSRRNVPDNSASGRNVPAKRLPSPSANRSPFGRLSGVSAPEVAGPLSRAISGGKPPTSSRSTCTPLHKRLPLFATAGSALRWPPTHWSPRG